MPSLLIRYDGGTERRVELMGETVTIGSDPHADIRLAGEGIRPFHAQVTRDPLRGWCWIDGRTRNERTLKSGYKATVGPHSVTFDLDAAGALASLNPEAVARDADLEWEAVESLRAAIPPRAEPLPNVALPSPWEAIRLRNEAISTARDAESQREVLSGCVPMFGAAITTGWAAQALWWGGDAALESLAVLIALGAWIWLIAYFRARSERIRAAVGRAVVARAAALAAIAASAENAAAVEAVGTLPPPQVTTWWFFWRTGDGGDGGDGGDFDSGE